MTIQKDFEAIQARRRELLERGATLTTEERLELLELGRRVDAVVEAIYPAAGGIENIRRAMRARHDSSPTLPAVRALTTRPERGPK